MRHLLISGLVVLATLATAQASERYPASKHYVSQTGQVLAVGQTPQMVRLATTLVRPAARAEIAQTQSIKARPRAVAVPTVNAKPARGVAVQDPFNTTRRALFSPTFADTN